MGLGERKRGPGDPLYKFSARTRRRRRGEAFDVEHFLSLCLDYRDHRCNLQLRVTVACQPLVASGHGSTRHQVHQREQSASQGEDGEGS